MIIGYVAAFVKLIWNVILLLLSIAYFIITLPITIFTTLREMVETLREDFDKRRSRNINDTRRYIKAHQRRKAYWDLKKKCAGPNPAEPEYVPVSSAGTLLDEKKAFIAKIS